LDVKQYLEVLKQDPMPFKSFVSRGDVPDEIDIPEPRMDAEEMVNDAILMVKMTRIPRIVPVIGDAGMGKTHFFWALKKREEENNTLIVYVPSPPNPAKVFLHFYTCLMDECGPYLIQCASKRILNQVGNTNGELSDMLAALARKYPGVYADVAKAILLYTLDEKLKSLAERWLYGETLSEEDMEALGIRRPIEEEDICFAALKMLIENCDKVVLLYLDEIESPLVNWGEDAERKFLDAIKRIYNEVGGVCFVITALPSTWKKITQIMDSTLLSRMDEPARLRKFSMENIKELYKKAMLKYWEQKGITPPDDEYFPLSEEELEEIYERSGGNPREAIKLIMRKIVQIATGRLPIDTTRREIRLTHAALADALFFAIKSIAEELGLQAKLVMAYSFSVGSKKQHVDAILEVSDTSKSVKIGLEIPNVRNWNRSGGVAAYYALIRLKNAILAGLVSKGILLVPKGTSGAKYRREAEALKDKVLIIEISEDDARILIEMEQSRVLTRERTRILEEIRSFISNVTR